MKNFFLTIVMCLTVLNVGAKKYDYSKVNVPEEGGVKFEKITEDADMVAIYGGELVKKTNERMGKIKKNVISWKILPQIALSPDGKKVAYISEKNKATNVMVKDVSRGGGASMQRTYRTNVVCVSWSPDGNTLCFTENRANHSGVYLVNAYQGSVVSPLASGNDNDYDGEISSDGNTIFFFRGDNKDTYSLWSYNRETNLFSNYSRGVTPCLIPDNNNTIYCARFTENNESEIWRINFDTGVEELILSEPNKSFTTPQLSPDGKWLLVTGCTRAEKEKTYNTDILVVRTDGSQLTQLTYHQGNDLSAVWAPDGKSIYFLSQRGSKDRKYNIWKMDVNLP